MTIDRTSRAQNQLDGLQLMLQELGAGAVQTTFFDGSDPTFKAVLQTSWAGLESQGLVLKSGGSKYRLTAHGWLIALEAGGVRQKPEFLKKVSNILAALKRCVKGRAGSAVATVSEIASSSGEPEGLVFNVIDSKASSIFNSGRAGATWVDNERGVLIDIPVNFGTEPIDIVAALSVENLAKIEDLEERLRATEEDRARHHCPDCDAEVVQKGDVDYPDHHCLVTYETYGCGLILADGFEESPCPFGPRWPKIDEFEFITTQTDGFWTCNVIGKTKRAKTIHLPTSNGHTKEEAEQMARRHTVPQRHG
jgi:hypothetical protein